MFRVYPPVAPAKRTMSGRTIGHVLLVVAIVVGMSIPAGAMAAGGSVGPQSNANGAASHANTPHDDSNATESNVSVTSGAQLSTVLVMSSDDVRTAFGDTAFELSVERDGETAKAEAIAERAEELAERAEAIREEYEAATDAYEDGELSRSAYAARLATLNGRAENLLASYEQLQERAESVSTLELRAAGLNETALDAAVEGLDGVTGAGPAALLARFTGQTEGEVELETADGLRIEVEGEDGERSRELERPRDDDENVTVAQADALETARGALSEQDHAWALEKASVHPDSGYYKFEFAFAGANVTGEAEVRVDGTSGEVFRLEEEIEPIDDRSGEEDEVDEEADDGHGGEHETTLLLVDGAPEPGATVSVRALVDGQPAEHVAVTVNDERVGETGADGTISITLPATEEVEIEAGDGELEFAFEAGHDEVFRKLDVSTDLADGTVTVTVAFDGAPVENATVFVNDERVGTTGGDGVATAAFDGSDEVEVEVVKGAFEAELEYAVEHGSLVLVEAAHEGDGDKAEREDREEGDEHESDGDREDERERTDDGAHETSLSVVHGEPAPNATVTVELLVGDAPAEGVTVYVNDEPAGETDAHGRLDVTLPDADDVRIEAGDAELRFEFDGDDDER